MIGEVIIILVFSIFLMFYWEKRVRFWLRLPIINLVLLVVLLIGVVIQEFYLTASGDLFGIIRNNILKPV